MAQGNPYTEIDFARAWKDLEGLRPQTSTSEAWDERSRNYDRRGRPGKDSYVKEFIELLGIREGESALDMGCGTGLVAIVLAKEGHPVVCADFSAGMLGLLERKLQAMREEGEDLPIKACCVSWEDDWPSCGIAPKSVDVAYASRSMAVQDLGDAVDKLSATARRRCAATLSCSGSPRCNDAILAAAGRESASRFDAAFLADVLWQKGFFPETLYIDSGHIHLYGTLEEMVEDVLVRLGEHSPVTDEEASRLEVYVKAHAHQTESGEWVLEEFNNMRWAFIAWNVDPAAPASLSRRDESGTGAACDAQAAAADVTDHAAGLEDSKIEGDVV